MKFAGFTRAVTGVLDLVAIPAVLLICFALITGTSSGDMEHAGIRTLIMVVAVVGLYTFMGNSGVLSFGHVSFAAIGAYVGALLSMNPAQKLLMTPGLPEFAKNAELAPVLAPFVGALVAVVFAIVIGIPIVRLSGLSAGLATFAVLVIVSVVISNWSEVTRGTQGLTGVPSVVEQPVSVLPWAIGGVIVGAIFQLSKSGRRLRASRSDLVAARSIGVSVERERFKAFVISAGLMGIAGGLYAQSLGTFGPSSFYLTLTFQLIAMLIIGGINSLSGAVVGGVVVMSVTEALLAAESGVTVGPVSIGGIQNLSQIGLALTILVILIYRPQGIMAGNEMRLRSLKKLLRRGDIKS